MMSPKELKDRIKTMEEFLKKYKEKRNDNALVFFPSPKIVEYLLDLYKNYDYISDTILKISDVNKDIEGANESIGNIKNVINKIADRKAKEKK